MTRDERIEAAFSAYNHALARLGRQIGPRDFLGAIIDAAYPELRPGSETHWIAPREMTAPAFRAAMAQVVNARPVAITDEVAGYLWSAARDAYLKAKP